MGSVLIIKNHILFLVLVIIVSFSTVGIASDILNDSELGFTMVVPSGFEVMQDKDVFEAKVKHAFVREDPDGIQPNILILIERTGTTITPGRIKKSDMSSDFAGEFVILKWKKYTINGCVMPIPLDNGAECISYSALVPLKKEAINIVVFGTMEQKAELGFILNDILAGLEGESNWKLNDAFSSSKQQASSKKDLWPYTVGGIVIFVVGLILLWLISRNGSRGTCIVDFITSLFDKHGSRYRD